MERPPERVCRAVAEALGVSSGFVTDAACLDPDPGSYVLTLKVSAPVVLRIPRFSGSRLEPGIYAYAGSARGPGGIAARVGRHFSAEKTVRWHIDHLTTVADAVWASVFRDAGECTLVARLVEKGAVETPLPGFGSSDCRTCEAHLLKFRASATGRP